MKIKICGLYQTRDVQLCIDLKVNYLGYKLAAERGYTKAQSNLGAIYEQPIDSQPAPSNPCIFILETIEVVSGTT